MLGERPGGGSLIRPGQQRWTDESGSGRALSAPAPQRCRDCDGGKERAAATKVWSCRRIGVGWGTAGRRLADPPRSAAEIGCGREVSVAAAPVAHNY